MSNDEIIIKLDLRIHKLIRKFLEEAKKAGFDLRITSGFRTWQEQDFLYAQGRTRPGKIVTNAKDGQSIHTKGLAIDVVDRKKGYEIDWQRLGNLGKSLGLAWGGDWSSFIDKPHFEKTKFEQNSIIDEMTDDQSRALAILDKTRQDFNFGSLEGTARTLPDLLRDVQSLRKALEEKPTQVEIIKEVEKIVEKIVTVEVERPLTIEGAVKFVIGWFKKLLG